MRFPHRFLPVVVALALAALTPARARAQATTTPTATALFTKDDFLMRLWQKTSAGEWVPLSTTEQLYFFNRARCECETPVQITVEYTASGQAKKGQLTQGTANVLVGPERCLDADSTSRANAHCAAVDPGKTSLDLLNLGRGREVVNTTVKRLFAARSATTPLAADANPCTGELAQKVWLGVFRDLKNDPDLTADAAPQLGLTLDGRAPTAPVGIAAVGGNEALSVSWKGVTGVPDLLGYLVFCSRGDDNAVFEPSFYNNQYQQCIDGVLTGSGAGSVRRSAGDGGADASAGADASGDANTSDGAVAKSSALTVDEQTPSVLIRAPDAFRQLKPAYLCSDLLTSQNSARLFTLQNGIPYLVGVSAVDKRGNASPIETVALQYPLPTRDFYRGYRGENGQAAGGYCTIVTPNGRRSHSSDFAAGVALIGALVLRRRRRQVRR